MAGWTDIIKNLSLGFEIGGAISGVANAYAGAKVSQVQSQAQKLANEAQATIADNNQQLAIWQAQDALLRGQITENARRLSTAQLKGTQRAAMGANNIALDEGSALRILADTDIMGEIDALTERDNAAREAWAYKNQAIDYGNRAEILRNATVPVPDSTGGAIAGSLISGAGKVSSMWYRYNQ